MENFTVLLTENVTEIFEDAKSAKNFSHMDYILFLLMLLSSAIIGVYFGCFGKKQASADEYLLGGREMKVFPISMSLIASYVSGITILGSPADVYTYGTTYILIIIAIPLNIIFSLVVFMPVFYKLQLPSTYQYLNLRFGREILLLSSFLYALQMILYLPIVIYIPALALAQGTGFNVHLITPVICSVCIFYTTIGGLKAVVWTDTIQFMVMIGATICLLIIGTKTEGGVFEVFKTSFEGGRLDMDFDIDLTKRDTFWSNLIGLFFLWMCLIGVSQGVVQKYLALPTIEAVRKASFIFGFGMVCFMGGSVYIGLLIYTKYHDCDPKSAGRITATDQLLPLYVIEEIGHLPGLPGLFIAGVFSASLSTLSATMNGLSCTIYEDFISPYVSKNISQKKISSILKWIVVIVGVICTGLVLIVEKLGNLLPLSLTIGGMSAGPVLGLFCLGMLAPSANRKGALYGGIGSLLIMSWIAFGNQYYKINNVIVHDKKSISIDGCPANLNATIREIEASDYQPWYIYQISFYYYTLIGLALVFILGLPISYITREDKFKVDKDLISPVMHWALPKPADLPPDYYSVEKANEMTEKA